MPIVGEAAYREGSLANVLASRVLTVGEALHVGLDLAADLEALHARRVVHRAVHPEAVIVNAQRGAKLVAPIDRPLDGATDDGIPLAYVSPEQTGRMDRTVDHRTDFYSLGATLYHALSGHPPFSANDSLELVHAHIAVTPVDLSDIDPSIPRQVSRVVGKLLAKNANDRYQHARALRSDLEKCLRHLESGADIEEFPLGLGDDPRLLQTPDALYGRTDERRELLDAFRVAASGGKLLVLVSGEPGIGKSSLVADARESIIAHDGWVISGKFEQQQRHVPYSALADALTQLSRRLLMAPEVELASVRASILERVGANASLLIDLVPDLETVLGTMPVAPPTGLVEAQHRFELTLARFLSVFATEDRPLVLFLDDLQWADQAALRVVVGLLVAQEPTHFLVVGTFRSNELESHGALSSAIDELHRASVEIRSIALSGLDGADVEQLIADALHIGPEEARGLADFVSERTCGNPLFVHELLRMLHEEQFVRLLPTTRGIAWDATSMRPVGFADNVVDLVARKLARLPEQAREALGLAACIGSHFSCSLLAEATGISEKELRARLAPAIRDRLVVEADPRQSRDERAAANAPEDDELRFAHEGTRQVAYDSVRPSRRPEAHLRIGRALLRIGSHARPRLFEIVDHLELGRDAITKEDDRVELLRLSLDAGKRARATNAYVEGLSYFRTGISLLSENAWTDLYREAYELHLGAAESAYLAGRFDDGDEISEAFSGHNVSPLEKAALYNIRIVLEQHRGNHRRALELGREALVALGHPIPRMRTWLPLLDIRAKVLLALHRRRTETLFTLPDLEDPILAAVADILANLHAPAYFTDLHLFFWLIHESLLIAVRHGITPTVGTSLTNYGLFLIATHDYEGALAFGNLGLRFVEPPEALAVRSNVQFIYAYCMNAHADHHVRTSLTWLERTLESALEAGNVLFASYAAAAHPQVMFLSGASLDEVAHDIEQRERAIRALRNDDMGLVIVMFRQQIRCLRGETESAMSLSSPDLSESTLVSALQASTTTLLRASYFIWTVTRLSMLGEHRAALEIVLSHDDEIEKAAAALLPLTEYAFCTCLAAIDALRDPSFPLERRAVRRVLAKKRRLLARWAKSAPVNFRHAHDLVRAELADLRGRAKEAVALYDDAIQDAATNGFVHHAALASERAGRAYARRNETHLARTYLEAARDGFVRWGATLKVARLDAERPELAPRRLSRPSERPGSLDLLGVVRASQALSSEIELPVLLERMMQVIVQTAGADRGSLLLERNGALCIEARVDAGSGVVDVLSELPLVGPTTVSEAIVRYAIRTGEDVVLADATHDDTFGHDPYVVAQGSKSILCMPVRHRDRTSGALFLENGLSTNAFTHERLEVLRILVAQAAISLENARLYDATQRLNKELAAGEARLREVFDGLPIGIYVVDLHGNPTFANPAAEQIVGKIMDPSAGISSLPATYSLYVAGTDEPYPVERMPIARALRGERAMADDIEIRLPDRTVPLATWGTPIRGEDGRVRYAVVAFQDISSQRAAESERAHLEEQLRQSERLEAIGRLAGGVAHDFNNLLTPMLVYSELAARSLPTDSAAYSQLGQIHDAAERAAEVTRQLLAFGRRQVLDSRLVDLNAEIREFEPILRRLVREDIAMDLRLDPRAGQTRADPVQIQRVLMNLVANAADAMPRGGRLGVETGSVESVEDTGSGAPPESLGPCVVLRISDTGHGMNDATLAKIFDPFFTTKAPGKGTGLGLPTVYGLVKQHGGHIAVHSELGVGSTFEVFLPRVSDVASEADRHVTKATLERTSGHGESILVVEDEAAVRSVVNDVLSSDGYEVTATGSPTEALKLAEALGDRLDLVVTDVIMPEMNGRELVAALSAERPGLAAVFISGYSEDAISAHGVLEPGIELLQKPFSIEALRARVREVLARRKRSEVDGTAAR